MKWLKKFDLFKESKNYSNKNLIMEICVSMILINNEFLDNILDKGQKARYSEDSQVFLTDLKNLLIAKNRLKLGVFIDEECVEDEEDSKINGYFDLVNFSIEKDWNTLVESRIIAREIIDKLLPDDKLVPQRIRNIYWLGPNKSKEHPEDIVIELNDGVQYSFHLNKSMSKQKTASFNKFAEEIIGDDLDRLFSDAYIERWNKLTQEWVKLIYENVNNTIKHHIEKFIDPNRIETLGYFDYFDITHSDHRYQNLGEYIKDFDKNILKLSDLLSEVWKEPDKHFMDHERVVEKWHEIKIVILNSKILENLFSTSLKLNHKDEITKLDNEYKLAEGTLKMNLFKLLVDKMGCVERSLYYINKKGTEFNMLPSRQFFRDYYNDLSIKFDYHVAFDIDESDEDYNNFTVKIKLELDNEELLHLDAIVKFSGGEMSGNLSTKYKFNISPKFNYLVSKKKLSKFN